MRRLRREYAADGAVLGLFARREAELARLAAALSPATVAIYAGDVRDAAALARAAADFIARFGAPDVVIANAGVSRGTLTDEPDDLPAFRAVLETNVLGVVHTFSPFMAALRAARRGALVGVASVGRLSRNAGVGRVLRLEGRRRSRISRACASSCAARGSRSSRSAPVSCALR